MVSLIKSTYYKQKDTTEQLVKFLSDAKQLSFGKQCEQFEENFAKWQGRKHCVMVNSGSSANLALIQALLNLTILEKDDVVGFSALTWSTNVMPLIQLGLKPWPIDVSLSTLNVSSKTLTDVLNVMDLKAVFLTNLLGFCDNIEVIKKMCEERNILLLEDNCESLGSVYQGKKLGNFGYASTFSFYVGHHMSTIEGGAICTDSDALAEMLRIVRAHGWDRNLKMPKETPSFYSRYKFWDLAYNFRPTEIQGFLGNIQLQYLDEIVHKRQENYFELIDVLEDKHHYSTPYTTHMDTLSSFAIPIVCNNTIVRGELVRRCEGKVENRPIVAGDITQQPFFVAHAWTSKMAVPNAKIVHNRGLYLPNNPEMGTEDMSILKEVLL